MNRNRRRNVNQPHGVGRQIPGCLGRMVNLFDFGTVGNGKKLLTDKPYFDDGSIKRNQFDQIEDNVALRNDCTFGVNGTPMKKLLEEEMSKEIEFKLGSTNLVAKLMGLDSFPQTPQPNGIAQRSNSSKSRLKRSLSQGEYKDVYEIWQKPGEDLSKKKMDLVREKFLEAKRLVTDDKLRHSKEFQEAMEYLSSNKELFLEFLQESNNFFSHHLQSFKSKAPPTPEKSKRITILKPSKFIDDAKLGNEAAIDSLGDCMKSENGLHLFNWPVEEEHPTKQSTRIVVLKPSSHVTRASSCPTSPRGLPVDESNDVARRVNRQMLREEALHSSLFSNDDSSLNRFEDDYPESEIMSPVSRHSWDYINKYESPFSSSSPFSRASGSPESSSVCREAKKRLSERWALMATSSENLQEAKVVEKKGANSTLGEMLALSDLRNEEEEEEANDGNEQLDPRVSASCLAGNEQSRFKPLKSLTRSKSLPESSTSVGHKALHGKTKAPEELTKSKSLKWSLKGKVSNFLFSRNKKASKDEESQVVNSEILDSRSNGEFDASFSARSMNSQEGGLSIAKSTTFGNSSEWRDEPSPISVLETSFDEDDGIFFNSSVLNRSSASLEPEMMSMRSNLLGKSPPIGSIGRNFSFEDSTVARCYSSKRSPTFTRDEEEDLRLLINTLLSAADLDEESESSSSSILDSLLSKWYSVESPLDPSLRDSYANSHQRLGSNVKKLVFDLVNSLLLELTPSYLGPRSSPMALSGKTLRVYIVNRMQECLTGKGRVEDRWWDEDGDLSSLAVNKVVRIEVAGIGSPESLGFEKDSMGEELELKLLEELVEEVLMDLSEEPKLLIPSIC
ncbi:hypothetical protein EUTSA_v10003146mg [Eutrema salsugineum]|uniref:DUF3741 domain-containing protein n=1 Tax=Eutrema salsugineum TaxID=72664 RepID=V4LQ77_EUTSA|nr:uncharacterized protein LOC18020448 [Eutrema salsugineum]XP_024013258.1 uncharacterized protein LOC18020448 [Eutrema salsugineum]ESQ44622.1 hypothetical protein EUTSA_v10003146mg [Eutrema salsugineum]